LKPLQLNYYAQIQENSMAFKFEKLEIWQLAIELSDKIDHLTQTFPKHEIFVLTSQMKRAADSVSLNIAEGSTGQSDAEQARFLKYALRSAIEVVNALYLSKKRRYLEDNLFKELYSFTEKLVIKIQAMIKRLE
jgi:four helix bundle protein